MGALVAQAEKVKTTTEADTTAIDIATTVVEEMVEEEEEDIKVVIDIDGKGKIALLKMTEEEREQYNMRVVRRPDSVLAFAQALYLPWLGLFFPSTSSSLSTTSFSSQDQQRPTTTKFISFLQALYFPWAGLFFPRRQQQ